jgi:hypothetical protein
MQPDYPSVAKPCTHYALTQRQARIEGADTNGGETVKTPQFNRFHAKNHRSFTGYLGLLYSISLRVCSQIRHLAPRMLEMLGKSERNACAPES